MLSFTNSVNSVSSNRRPTTSTPFGAPSKRVSVPGIGTAIKVKSIKFPSLPFLQKKISFFSQSPQGVLEVKYLDGAQLTVLPKDQGGGLWFRNSRDDNPMLYRSKDVLPELMRQRLEEFPKILDFMAASEASQTPVQPRRVNDMRFCR